MRLRPPPRPSRLAALDGMLAELAELRARCTDDEVMADLLDRVDPLLDERLHELAAAAVQPST